ncbi:MAG: beta galactosidase jelly roll domain-containing protein [Cyclobacteriaceae bacterium]|nr:beta galactosidase jelly roll domain-containing protein [Cyclobacteriaceae bacterium]
MKLHALFLFALLIGRGTLSAQTINLEGSWKFNIGDKAQWASPTFDDADWEYIHAPSPWEDEGFNGYDGFAWYRKKFDGRKLDKNETYYLGLGFIDDTDEVFVNGKLIGFSGSPPPKFKTAFNSERKYTLPTDVVNFIGENTIAIRVYDVTHGGGIVDGDLGIFRLPRSKSMLVDLQGIWSFATSWTNDPITREKDWKNIMVPGAWEHQGYWKYDGFAWYKRTFTLPEKFTNEPLVLVLGKIDDFDKVYLNGKLIGRTNDRKPFGSSQSFSKTRVYDIPAEVLKRNGINTIEILVEDMGNIGGIYEGPVGITTRDNAYRYEDD